MNRNDINKAARCTYRHGRILCSGLLRTAWGAAAAGLAGVAVYIFAAIPAEGGYAAVIDFIGAVATAVVAISNIYAFGAFDRRSKRAR